MEKQNISITNQKNVLFDYAILARRHLETHFNHLPLAAAMISNKRDKFDEEVFGAAFKDEEYYPWIGFVWQGKNFQLFMINSSEENMSSGIEAHLQKAEQQFENVVQDAYARGARKFLFAAHLKRLATRNNKKFVKYLQEKFPGSTFSIGDSLTGLLVGEWIKEDIKLLQLSSEEVKILVLAPHGFLGRFSVQYAKHYLGCKKIVGIGSSARADILKKVEREFDIPIYNSFAEMERCFGKVDIVVACSQNPMYRINKRIIELIRNPANKMRMPDPCQPPNTTIEEMFNCRDIIIRRDAGNALGSFSFVPPYGQKLLRLDIKGAGTKKLPLIWGCFAQLMLESVYHSDLDKYDWTDVTVENVSAIANYMGEGDGKFRLPPSTNFGIITEVFDRIPLSRLKTVKNIKNIRHEGIFPV